MSETSLHRPIAVAALVALAALSGAVAPVAADSPVAPTTADASTSPITADALAETDGAPATSNQTTTDDGSVDVTFVYEGERLVVRQAESQRIRLRTDADPGTEITVEARAGGKFLKTRNVVVAENGTATATFDFSDVAANTDFTVSVRRNHEYRVDGIVVNDTATLAGDEPLTVHPGGNLTVRGETTADPGTQLVLKVHGTEGTKFLKTDAVTVSENGTFAAGFEFANVEAGTEFEVTVMENATLPSGPVEGSVVAETTARTTTVDESGFPFTTTTTSDNSSDGHVDEFGPDVPGFGLPATLVALLAALALARRARD